MSYTEQYLIVLSCVLTVVAVWNYFKRRAAEIREHYITEALVAVAKKEATITITNNLIEIVKHGAKHETSKQD